VWIADLGDGAEDPGEVVGRVVHVAAQGKPAFVVWILQPVFLESPSLFDQFFGGFGDFVHMSRGTVEHCVVVPHGDARHRVQMKRLAELGISVHHAAEDGTCFLEVHTPDGIVIGVPGMGFDDDADVPRDLDTLIRDMADRQDPDDQAELFARLRSMRLVFPYTADQADELARAKREGGTVPIPSTTVYDREVAVSYASGAHPALGELRFELRAEEVMRMVLEMPGVDGLLIQSTGTGWLVISREKISKLLAAGD
jgi:hypothetical protein